MQQVYTHRFFITSLLVSIGVCAGMLYVGFDTAILQWRSVSYPFLFLALAAVGLEILLRGLRLQVITSIWKRRLTFGKAIRINLSGDFANAVTPGSIGGGPVRGYHLTRSDMTVQEATSVVIGERITDHLALIVLVATLLFTAYDGLQGGGGYILLMGGVSLIGCLGCYLYFRANGRSDAGIIHWLTGNRLLCSFVSGDRLQSMSQRFISFWNTLRDDLNRMVTQGGNRFIACAVLAVINQFTRVSIPVFLAAALHLDIPIAACMLWIVGKRYGLDSLPIPGANGVTETAFLWFFSGYATVSMLAPFLILWRFCSYYVYLLLGGLATLWMIREDAEALSWLKRRTRAIGPGSRTLADEAV